jgi:creatinine amidohydrolase
VTKVQAELMRPDEVLEARRRAPVAFLPIGPLEWHGPHLPLGTDGLHAHHVAAEVARTVGGIVLPPLFAGADSLQGPGTGESIEHLGLPPGERVLGMDYPGNPVRSSYVDEGVVGLLVRELVRSLKQEPYKLFVIVNGHGAPSHQRVLRRVALEESEPDGMKVLFVTAWTPPRPPATNPGHADRLETSLLMALEPDAVDVSRLPRRPEKLGYADFGIVDGAAFDGRPQPDLAVPDENDPRNSSADEGAHLFEGEVQHVREIVVGALTAGDRDRLWPP